MAIEKILVCRFPYGGVEHHDTVDFLIGAVIHLKERGMQVESMKVDATPITMGRNRCMEYAVRNKFDKLLMVDSDMAPDLYAVGPKPSPRFLPTALDFMATQTSPCVIGAPYCGPPPHENVYVFEWANHESGTPNADIRLAQFTRERAAMMSGTTEVAALPTGLMLLDVRGVAKLPHPRTYYEFVGDGKACPACKRREAGPSAYLSSTEDVTFSRDLQQIGVKQFCTWDCWAGHHKRKLVGKPVPYTVDFVNEKLREAVASGRCAGDKIVEAKDGLVFGG